MKDMRVWKVITNVTEDQDFYYYDAFSLEDQSTVRSRINEKNFFDYDFVENGMLSSYVICPEEIMEMICNLCDGYEINLASIDITEEFLMGLHDIPSDDFDNYRLENLTEDIIYLKVKKFGGKSLDEVDKHILENC